MSTDRRESPSKTRLWSPDETEDGLLGFVHREERDACAEGHPGPFTRIVRPESWGPVPADIQFVRDLWSVQRLDTRRLN